MQLSLSKGTLAAGLMFGVLLVAGAFGAGFLAGQRASDSSTQVAASTARPSIMVPIRKRATVNKGAAVAKAVAAPTADKPPDEPTKAKSASPAAPEPEAGTAPAAASAEPKVPSIELRRDPPKGRFGVQLGAFQSMEEASEFVSSHHEALGTVPLFVMEVEIRGRGTWYRVRAGAERTRRAASGLKAKLPSELAKNALIVGYK